MPGARFEVFALAVFVSACGMHGAAGAGAESRPEPMPPGAHWDGVYQGPYHLDLRILTSGAKASGSWLALGERKGEFTGQVNGNLLKYVWSESKGAETWSGRGYFEYRLVSPGKQEIVGEWGLGQNEGGHVTFAVKRPDVPLNAPASRLVGDDNGDQDRSRGSCPGCEDQEEDQDTL